MKPLKKIAKYFIITFSVTLVCVLIRLFNSSVVSEEAFDILGTHKALHYYLIIGLMSITALVTYSIGIAALFAFDAMKIQTWKEFAHKLAIGLILIIPLSVFVYSCDWFVYPEMKKTFTIMQLEIGTSYPEELAEKNGINKEEILDGLPSVMPRSILITKLDSIKSSFRANADTCEMYLSALPDSMAIKAYNSYQLRSMGIDYYCASQPIANVDSLRVIQEQLLYQYTLKAWYTSAEIRTYSKEYSNRTINALCIYLSYFLSALIAYLLRRYKPVKKLLAVLAIVIVFFYMFNQVGAIVQKYAEKTQSISKKVDSLTGQAVNNKNMEKRKQKDNEAE